MAKPRTARPPVKPQYLSVNDAADYTGVSTSTIRRYIENGRLRAYRMGQRLVKVQQADLDALMRPIPAAGR